MWIEMSNITHPGSPQKFSSNGFPIEGLIHSFMKSRYLIGRMIESDSRTNTK